MAVMAVVFPIQPGMKGEWREFMSELNGARRAEFVDSRERAGVRERTFLQAIPMADVVVVTLEGDDPARSFAQIVRTRSPFMKWFKERALAIHGVDITAPIAAPPSELVADTGKVPVLTS